QALGARRGEPLRFRGGDERAERTLLLAGRGRPVEPDVPGADAGDSPRIFVEPVAERIFRGVVPLRFDIGAADLDCVQLVPADAAFDDLLGAGLDVEKPTRSSFDERNWIGPFLLAEDDDRLVRALHIEAMRVVVG